MSEAANALLRAEEHMRAACAAPTLGSKGIAAQGQGQGSASASVTHLDPAVAVRVEHVHFDLALHPIGAERLG